MNNNIKHNLYNTHSWNYFTGLRGIWSWQLRKGDWARCVRWLRRGTALSHKHNAQRVQSLQNIKSPPAILSCNIHVDTLETTMSEFGLAVEGSSPTRQRISQLSWLRRLFQRGDTHCNPSALRQERCGGRPQLESVIRRRVSSVWATFDQTSYLDVTSHFTK